MTSDTAGNREDQLRFQARPRDIRKFKRAVAAVSGDKSDWSETVLTRHYFDTRDSRLAQRGVSLTLRRDGEAVTQVVAGDAPGAPRWEQPATGDAPDLAGFPADARRAVGTIIAGELSAVIVAEVTRQTATLRRDAIAGPPLTVAVVIDQGSVGAAGRSEPMVECALTRVAGDIDAFFQLAADIHAACPLALSNQTVAARGRRLLGGTRPSSRKAPKIDIKGNLSIHRALAEVFATGIANILDNEPACLDGRDVEGVHQARVSIRRLRSAMKVFAPYVEPSRLAWLADDLQWLGNALGPARDWDVYVTETLAAIDSDGIDKPALATLLRAARRKRAVAYAGLRKTLQSPRYARLMFRLTAFVALDGWLPRPFDPESPVLRRVKKAAPRILRRLYKKLLREAEGLADLDMAARHRVRIRLKKLRYAVDFLQGVYPSADTRDFLERLRRLQDQFGHLNDAAQAARLTDELTGTGDAGDTRDRLNLAAGQVLGWYARLLRDANDRLLADWQAFVATRPFWETGKAAAKEGSPP